VVSLIPLIALVMVGANQNFPFGGTSILIVVGVGLETVKQIESQLQQRHYEGILAMRAVSLMRLVILGPPAPERAPRPSAMAASSASRRSPPVTSSGKHR
jgi:hypothetical protein